MNQSISIYEIIGRYVMAKQEAIEHRMEGHNNNNTGCDTSPGSCPIMRTIMGRLNELEYILRGANNGALPDLRVIGDDNE